MYYKDCINNDPGLNLTHFMAMSNLVKIDNYYYYFIYFFLGGGDCCSLRPKSKSKQSTKVNEVK